MVFGILLRQAAILQLGGCFSTTIHVNKGKQLVSWGLYKYIRNPSYTGALLTLIGITLAFGAWVATIIIGIFGLMAYLYRVKYEEKNLIKSYGKEYIEYMKQTWRFFPGF
jgi:protein-S-isoprenylcysteine O-methyltransferase Ste14